MKRVLAIVLVLVMGVALVACSPSGTTSGGAAKPVVKVIGSQEFFTSPAGMPTFEKAYGFTLKSSQIIALATGDTAVTEKAVAQGTSGANAAMAYGTDGTLSALGLVVLTDPKAAQPIYQPAPTVRQDVFAKYPELATILDPVFSKLTLETLQDLNGQIAVQGKDPKVVATTWLTQQGLLTSTTPPKATKGPIRVGSKIDIEGPLLGQMMIAMLRANGFNVVDKTRTGATDVVRKALLSNQIDMYPEYTANGVLVFLTAQKIDPAVLKSASQTYETVKTLDLKVNNVVWLQPAPANNTWAVAVTKAFAQKNHLVSMADWAAYINR